MGTCLALFGVTMVLLTTIPIGRFLVALAPDIQERHQVILLVLPCTTFTELAGIHIDSWVLPTHTWPRVASKPELGSFFLASEELVSKELTLTELILACPLV